MKSRWLCEECRNVCLEDELLDADNPFKPGWTVVGCPNCLEVSSMVGACDTEPCDKRGIMGTQTADGYRWTCYRHKPD